MSVGLGFRAKKYHVPKKPLTLAEDPRGGPYLTHVNEARHPLTALLRNINIKILCEWS